MAEMDFLFFPVASIRRSIKDIDDSYKNPWDIFAELTQNAIDAIQEMRLNHPEEKGKIKITVDAQKKSIVFEDNGCGISSGDLPSLLQLFSSGKENKSGTVGEKGVGLKFVYFQSKYFEITSSDGNSGGRAIIKDARLWKESTSNELLKLDFEEIDNLSRGTKIVLKDVELEGDDSEQATSVFKLTFDQFKFALRNKTFLGDTSYLWDTNRQPAEIIVDYTDCNGEHFSEELENKYILPTESLTMNDIVDLDEFESWIQEKDRSDSDKRNKLQGKVLTLKGTYYHNGNRKISYWACFLPSRRDWDNININSKLLRKEDVDNEEWITNNRYCMFKNS